MPRPLNEQIIVITGASSGIGRESAIRLGGHGATASSVIVYEIEPGGVHYFSYPGDEHMRTWRQASPYQWVGYYLPAPCHRDTSFSGRRQFLTESASRGWDFEPRVSTSRRPRCTGATGSRPSSSPTGRGRCG